MPVSLALLLDEIVRPGGELKITRHDVHPAWSVKPRWKATLFDPRQDSPYPRAACTITANTAVELAQKLEERL
jgi:hypothetical protein